MDKEKEMVIVSGRMREDLLSLGYFFMRATPSGVCAISKQDTLYSVFCNISNTKYKKIHYTFCYTFESLFDAYLALYEWSGELPLSGNWISVVENDMTVMNSNYKPKFTKMYFNKVA